MSDMLFVLWMITGSILGIILSIMGKNTTIGMVAGFVAAPMLPFIILWAAIDYYVARSTSTK